MVFKAVAAFFFSLLALPASQASEAMLRDFSASAQALPSKAQRLGYRSFGDLDLESFRERISLVQIKIVNKIAHKQALGPFEMERDGAEWRSTKQGNIAVSGPRWSKLNPKAKPLLALHETLGALKFSDEDFGCSFSLWAVTDEPTRKTLSRDELARFETNANQSCVARGGSTVVTGGGDEYNAMLRISGLENGLADISLSKNQEERAKKLNALESALYNGYGISPNKKAFSRDSFLSSVKLARIPRLDSIKVFYRGARVPQDAKNGWSYNPATNSVQFHGRFNPANNPSGTGLNESPGVIFQNAE